MFSGRCDSNAKSVFQADTNNGIEMLTNLIRYVSNNPVNLIDPTGLTEVGMHWISQSVFKNLGESKIDLAAFQLFEKFTTIPDVYIHGNDTWFPSGTRITHDQYNRAIREWIDRVVEIEKKITQQSANRMIRMFTESGFSEEAKSIYGLSDEAFQAISRYRRGFFESVDLAEQFVRVGGEGLRRTSTLKELVQYAQITSRYGDDESAISKLADADTLKRFQLIKERLRTTKNTAAVKTFRYLQKLSASNKTGWLSGLLGKAAGSRVARVLGSSVGLVFLANDAWAGAAGEGHHEELDGWRGAIDNAAYNAMFGPVVEGAVETAIKTAGAPIGNMPSPMTTRRGLQRGVEAFAPGVVSGVGAAISHEKDVPDSVPEEKYQTNWFWRLLGYE